MAGALYLMTQNGMIGTGLMAFVMGIVILFVFVGGIAMGIEWLVGRFKK